MSVLKLKPKNSKITPAGWEDKDSGELLVAIKNLPTRIQQELDEVKQKLKWHPDAPHNKLRDIENQIMTHPDHKK